MVWPAGSNMEKFEGKVFTALCTTNILISSLVFSKITREQREPYMDEIFHVPQAQKFCEGKFYEWDPMITTLPGLYLVSVGLIQPVVWLAGLSGRAVCSAAMLRFINTLFNCGNLYLLYLVVCHIHHKDKSRTACRRILTALALSTFPVLYFFTFLYYTDAGSTFFILFAYLMTLYASHKMAALLGVCAILFRQTNVVWVVFCAGTVVAQQLDEAWAAEQAKKRDHPRSPSAFHVPLSVAGGKRLVRFLWGFVTTPANVKTVVVATWPYLLVGAGFVSFVVLNGGIVVGDRTSHEACLNFPQLFYFLSFTLLLSLPLTFCPRRLLRFLQSVRRQPLLYLALFALALLLVWRFTHVHKYLLADNRHFPFYVWQRVFQRHPLVRYLLVPVYVFAAWSFQDTLLQGRSLFWALAFAVCLVVSTVPQKLLEFRYYIVPYLLYRLHMPLASTPRLLLEFGLYTAVNAATVYIFLYRTFQWPDSTDVQRFMW
ncbi:dol-P-Glc:Glc(2)Man(9)GlcNAc(2)-PP-Dol alpha-1,2-glucosyltransferase [Engraulis encrasicolus]|uniref:dol-P-Glc:Glc(2)Man(9)GlcNAc(2)-PP-Dol alpha-1,2-glucosyltransferase n=1 Tax=Engraulis encrasicolus TaxID=184585 RepID=UPI002FD64C3E